MRVTLPKNTVAQFEMYMFLLANDNVLFYLLKARYFFKIWLVPFVTAVVCDMFINPHKAYRPLFEILLHFFGVWFTNNSRLHLGVTRHKRKLKIRLVIGVWVAE